MENRGIKFIFTLAVICTQVISTNVHAATNAQTFAYQGRFLNATGTAPLKDVVDLTFSVYDSAAHCLLYQEIQTGIDLSATNGSFSTQVGSATGAAKRTADDPHLTMAQIFSNGAPIRAPGGNCAAGYTGVAGDARILRVSVFTHATSTTTVISPDLAVNSVPQAQIAETIQGLAPSDLIQSASGVAGQQNVSLANLIALTNATDASTLHNHDGRYVKTGTGGTAANLGTSAYTSGTFGIGTNSPGGNLGFDGTSGGQTIEVNRNTTANTSGGGLSILAGGASSGGTNQAGGALVLSSGVSTGSAGSAITFQTSTAGAGGTADNSPSTKMTLTSTGRLGVGTSSPGGQIEADAASASTVGTIIKGFAAQVADLLQVQTNTGTVVAKIAPDGAMTLNGPLTLPGDPTNGTQAATKSYVDTAVAGASGGVSSFNTRTGAISLTSADVTTALTYTPLKNSTDTMTGNLTVNGTGGFGGAPGANTQFQSSPTVATNVGAVVKGFTGQSVDLMQFQDHTGAVLSKVDKDGYIALAGDPTSGSQAATKSYVDTVVGGSQPAGNYLTALTGDVTATGPGSVGATVATVGTSSAANVHTAEVAANAAASANTPSTIVKRDGSGNFTAGTITGALTGAASSNVLKAGDTMTGALKMNTATTTDALAQVLVATGADTKKGVVVQGNSATQSADLSQWQSSVGAVLAKIDPTGKIFGTGLDANSQKVTNVLTPTATTDAANKAYVDSAITGAAGVASFNTRTGAVTLTSGDVTGALTYTPLKNSTDTMTGNLTVNGTAGIGGAAGANTQFQSTATAATQVGTVVKGAAAQTADLSQWQSSAGTALAKVDPTGKVFGTGLDAGSQKITNVLTPTAATDATTKAYVDTAITGAAVDWTHPGTIGSATANTGAFTTLSASSTVNLSSLTPGSVPYIDSSKNIAQDNANFFWDATNHRLGIGTTSPASMLHLATDNTTSTNYGVLSLGAAPFDGAAAGHFLGSGAGTDLAINAASGYTGSLIDTQIAGVSKFSVNYTGAQVARIYATAGLYLSPSAQVTGAANDNNFTLQARNFTSANTAVSAIIGTTSNSSGQFNGFAITPTYNQTSTAAATDFLINRTETAVGSGSQKLIDAQVGGVSKFSVSNTGVITGNGSGLTNLPSSSVDWAHPGTIGSTTPNTGAFTSLSVGTTGTDSVINLNRSFDGTATGQVTSGLQFTSLDNLQGGGTNFGVKGASLYTKAFIRPTGFGVNAGTGGAFTLSGALHARGSTADNTTNAFVLENSSSTNLMTVRDDGTVGIGTTTPGNKLQVNAVSAAASEALLRLSGGSTGFSSNNDAGTAYSIVFDGSAYNGSIVQRDGAKIEMAKETTWNQTAGGTGIPGALLFYTSSGTVASPTLTEKMRITSGGNVGIGTATPTADLQLKAGTATAGTAPLKLTSGTNLTTPEAGALEYDGTSLYYTDSTATRRTISTGAVNWAVPGTIGSTTPNTGAFTTLSASSTVNLSSLTSGSVPYIDSSKNIAQDNSNFFWDATNHRLGIGTTTPAYALDMYSANGTMHLFNTSNAATDVGSTIQFGGNYTTGSSPNVFASIYGKKDSVGPASQRGYMGFAVSNGPGTGGEAMRIEWSGNVGIGTSTPGASLQVSTAADATIAEIIQGHSATQSADLTQWQSSAGAVLAKVDATGKIFGTGLDASSQKITNVLTPTATTDAATKAYVDTAITGATVNWAVPGTIGSTTPNTGAFTSLAATSITNSGSYTQSGTAANTLTGNLIGTTSHFFSAGNTSDAVVPYVNSGAITASSTNYLSSNPTMVVAAGFGAIERNAKLVLRGYNNANNGVYGAGIIFDLVAGGAGSSISQVANTSGAPDLELSTNVSTYGTGNHLRFTGSGNLGVGLTAPTATLQIKAGTATAGTAPLKLTSGTNLTTPEAGAIEYDGTSLYYTDSTATRRTLSTGTVNWAVPGTIGSTTPNTGAFTTLSASSTVNLSSLTSGSVAYIDSSKNIAQDNANFFWDATNHRLGVGNAAPGSTLDVIGSLSMGPANYELFTAKGTPTSGLGYFNFTRAGTGALYPTLTVNPTSTASSGVINFTGILPTVNQSSTGGYRAFWISPYESTTGSGIKYLIDAGTNSSADGGGTHTSKFVVDDTGKVGIGVGLPTANLLIKAGTATAGTAPLKLTSGVNLTTPEAGAIEYDGTSLYYTDSTATRRTLSTGSATNWAVPGTIGSTTPNTGAFTTLAASGGYTQTGTSANTFTGPTSFSYNGSFIPMTMSRTQSTNDYGSLMAFLGGAAGSTNRGWMGFTHTGTGSATLFTGELADAIGIRAETAMQFGIGGGAPVMTFANSGKIGIGTNAPGQALSVVGTVESTSGGFKFPDGTTQTTAATGNQWTTSGSNVYYSTGNVGVGMAPTAGLLDITPPVVNSSFTLLSFGRGGSHDVSDIAFGADFSTQIRAGYGDLALMTANSLASTATEVMRATQNGRVGIGTTTPGEVLEVNGNVKATSYLYTSDRRLKTEIKPVQDPVAKILKLDGVNFTWKKDGVKALGFIAQDVEKVLPEVVNTDKTTTLKSVQYANIVAVVVEAFKSFYHEVNEHFHQVENRVAKLESVNATEQKQAEEINQLKKENEQMQAKIDALSRSVSSLMQASQLKKASSSKRVPASTESH